MAIESGVPIYAQRIPPELLTKTVVLSSRADILEFVPKNITFAEVGVALGDFSNEVLKRCAVSKFIAIDFFELEKYPNMWGGRVGKTLGGMSQEEFYRERFGAEIESGLMEVRRGDSVRCISELEDNSVDIFYLDANHSYQSVKNEIRATQSKLRKHGILIFNDYIMNDWATGAHYGVVQAVNEFMIADKWEMLYFALHNGMYCDVAIRKII